MKIIFLGTADFAVPALEALAAQGHEIGLVVCQPDRKSGRGMKLKSPPLKETAQRLGLEVFQPEKIKDPQALERILALKPELLCVVAYGQILPKALLEAPSKMPLNVHGSLLPKYRGAAPVEWAVAKGESKTGVCVQRMVEKLDAGEVLLSRETPLGPDECASDVLKRLAPLGAQLLLEALTVLEKGAPELRPQDEAQASYAPLLKKSDGAADPKLPAQELYNRFRAFRDRPGFYLGFKGEALRVHAATPDEGSGPAGQILEVAEKGLRLACGKGSLWLKELQSPGAARMPALEWARGRRVSQGANFEKPGLEV